MGEARSHVTTSGHAPTFDAAKIEFQRGLEAFLAWSPRNPSRTDDSTARCGVKGKRIGERAGASDKSSRASPARARQDDRLVRRHHIAHQLHVVGEQRLAELGRRLRRVEASVAPSSSATINGTPRT
jgi:hypothetical protein